MVTAAPRLGAGWSALGTLYGNLGKSDKARKALEQAFTLDPKPPLPQLALARAHADLQDWKAADATAQALMARDPKHTYVEAHFLDAIALYRSHDFDNALARIHEAIQFDTLREVTRAEYVQGLILEAKGDYECAGRHLQAYVTQHPRAKDAAKARERLANLGKEPLADLASELTPQDMRVAAAGDARGGSKACSLLAVHLRSGMS